MMFLALAACASGQTDVPVSGAAEVAGPADVVAARRESTVTRIGSQQEAYGVGYIANNMMGCSLNDATTAAYYSNAFGAAEAAWAVWSLDAIPGNAEVIRVVIEHNLWPDPSNEPELETVYAGLGNVPLPPPACEELWGQLFSGPVYAQVPMGTSDGLRSHELGGSVIDDVERLLGDRALFAVAIRTLITVYPTGRAELPGWSAGGVDLLVTWRDPSPVDVASWGSIKALFRE
jgi:hypothetical protein